MTSDLIRRAAAAIAAHFGRVYPEAEVAAVLAACPALAEAVAKAGALDALEKMAAHPLVEDVRLGFNGCRWDVRATGDSERSDYAEPGYGPTLSAAIASAAGRGEGG